MARADGATGEAAWLRQDERGHPGLIAAAIRLVTTVGYPAGAALLGPGSAFYLLRSTALRRDSAEYLAQALGRRPRPRDLFRHVHTFAATLLDRVFLLARPDHGIRVDVAGIEHLKAAAEAGRGGVLVGAHLGCFEAIRAVGVGAPVVVRPLMVRRPTGTLSRLLDRINPQIASRVIEIGSPEAMLAVGEAVARGEFVAVLADRAVHGHATLPAPFLGRDAWFPTGPFVLAAALGAPVFLCFGLRVSRRRYRVVFEPFADRMVLPRGDRAAGLREAITRFAAKLEELCRLYPYNWFNFYPFWTRPDAAPPP